LDLGVEVMINRGQTDWCNRTARFEGDQIPP
jgi:hypothetical protein